MPEYARLTASQGRRIARHMRQFGERTPSIPRRPRRRINIAQGFRIAWAEALPEGIPSQASGNMTIVESYDGSNEPNDVALTTNTFSETAFETGTHRGTIFSFDGNTWYIMNEDRECE